MLHRLVLLSHASTDAVRRQRFASDEGLEPRGVKTAQNLAEAIRAPARVLSSPGRAALETAAALSLMPATEPELRDLDTGRWSGLAIDDLMQAEPEGLASWTTDPHACPHDGETLAALVERVAVWLHVQRGERATLAITHALVVRAAITAVLGAPAEAVFRIDVPPLTQALLAGDGRRWTFRGLVPPDAALRP